MKLKSLFLGALFVFTLYIFFPYIFIRANKYLLLPVIKYPGLNVLGLVMILLGISPALYALFLFIIEGRGTPVPTDPPRYLVVKGLYRYCRNPMYVGHLIAFFGAFLLFGDILLLVYCCLAVLFFYLLVTKLEEPVLKKRFGQKYQDYCQQVPRWGIKL